MTETTIQKILPGMIIFDAGTQARTKTDIKTCEAYIESMKHGANFPPLEVFSDGTSDRYILADGFHRLQSHMSFRPNEPIQCCVHFGTLEDAQWFAITANKTHGLRRTNEDKRKAVKMALLHQKSRDEEMSDRTIAEVVGVSDRMVNGVRAELISTAKLSQSTRRKGKDGRIIDTANIGQTSMYAHLNEPPEPESNIRTNADGKQVNIKSFDFTAKRQCKDCDNWDPETGICECDDSPQPSWTPGCDDWVKREFYSEEDEIEVVRLRTNKRQETTRTNTEKSHYVREEHITCKIYTQNPQLTVVELRTLLGEEYLFRLQKAIESMCKED